MKILSATATMLSLTSVLIYGYTGISWWVPLEVVDFGRFMIIFLSHALGVMAFPFYLSLRHHK